MTDSVQVHGSRGERTLLMSAVMVSCSHIFCCVLPAVFGGLALLSTFGLAIAMPGWLESLHDAIHEWEPAILTFSGVIVALGWGSFIYSRCHDCRDHGGDGHETCQPRKKAVSKVLLIASTLFVINLIVFFGFHWEFEGHDHEHHGHSHYAHHDDHVNDVQEVRREGAGDHHDHGHHGEEQEEHNGHVESSNDSVSHEIHDHAHHGHGHVHDDDRAENEGSDHHDGHDHH